MSKTLTRVMFAGALLAMSSSASAVVIYDESVSGDADSVLPGVNLGSLALGTSTVVGTLTGEVLFVTPADDDWFSFVINPAMQLDAIILSAFTGIGGNAGWALGGTIQDNFRGPVNAGEIGNNLLATVNWETASPSLPFGPGNYGFKLGTGTANDTYAFDFVVSASTTSAVPEPGTIALLGLGLLGVVRLRRR